MENLKVSVIIASYNASLYIKKAIESVTRQVGVSLEVIICDDFSSDQTAEIVLQMAQIDPRIKLISNKTNKGPSYSRNRAIDYSTGEWIALLDADDFYKENRLKTLIEAGESNNADLVADKLYKVDIKGENPILAVKTTMQNFTKTVDIVEFLKNDRPNQKSLNYGFLKPILRRSFLLNHSVRYNENVRFGEDFVLYIECLLKGAKLLMVNEPFYYYRIVPGSLSRKAFNSKIKMLWNAHRDLIELASTTNHTEAIKLLKHKQKFYKSCMDYEEIINLLKNRRFFLAMKKLFIMPGTWLIFQRESVKYVKKLLSRSLHFTQQF